MSARKFENRGTFRPVLVHSRQTWLTLAPEDVCIRKIGVEFRSLIAFEPWTEMTVDLESTRESGRVHCHGVVVGCEGNRHEGYIVSMLFTGISRQSQEKLNQLALA